MESHSGSLLPVLSMGSAASRAVTASPASTQSWGEEEQKPTLYLTMYVMMMMIAFMFIAETKLL